MSMLFESTANDIFRKFDMLLNRELGYSEFKGFCDCVDKHLTEDEFNRDILGKFASTKKMNSKRGTTNESQPSESQTARAREGGLTLEGFKRFLVNEIENNMMKEDQMFEWLANLGYDEDLYSIRSRCFMLTFHSTVDLSVSVRDAVQTDLDMRTNLLVTDKFGQELEVTANYRILYTFSEQILAYSYSVQNLTANPLDITLDFGSSQNMLLSSKGKSITKTVLPNQVEFMMHTMAKPSVSDFKRSVKCSI